MEIFIKAFIATLGAVSALVATYIFILILQNMGVALLVLLIVAILIIVLFGILGIISFIFDCSIPILK